MNIDELIFDDKNFNLHTTEGKALIERSLREHGAGRSVLIDKDNRLIGGNGVVEAAKAVGISKVKVVEVEGDELVAVKRKDVSLDSKKGRAMALADNATAAADLAWDEEAIRAAEKELNISAAEWGLDLDFETDGLDITSGSSEEQVTHKKKAWQVGKSGRSERRCNLVRSFNFHVKMETSFHACFNSTPEGYLLYEIKENFENVPAFAQMGVVLIRQMGLFDLDGYAIVAAPKRRHKDRNFADCVCEELSKQLGIPYHANIFSALNTDRIHPKFAMLPIKEKNIIFYDDILTTGSTMLCCYRLLKEGGALNVLNVIGINNT